MELSEAINKIVKEFGKEVIAEKRFVYMIADYYSFRDNPAEKRVLIAIVNDGYSAQLLDSEDGVDISIVGNQIVEEVCKNYGFREELVKEAISYLVNGIGYNYQRKDNLQKPSDENITKTIRKEIIKTDTLFYLKRTTNRSQIICDAVGHYNFVDGSFVIHKGSLLCMRLLKLRKYIGTSGDKYVKRKFILDKKCSLQRKELYIVETNITCSSPSEAAFIVTCKETNGLNAWKDKKGKSLKQFLDEQNR